MKEKPQNGRKYLEIIYLIRDYYLEYIKYLHNTIIKKKPNNPILKWTKYLNRYFSKNIYIWPVST